METKELTETKDRSGVAATAELLRDLVCAFVNDADAVRVDGKIDCATKNETLTLTVSHDDYPRVYGSMGKNMAALQTMFDFVGAKEKREIIFILPEPPYPPNRPRGYEPRKSFIPCKDWNPDPMLKLLHRVLQMILNEPIEAGAFGEANGTTVQIKASNDADQRRAEILVPHIDPIFAAIGRQQGRKLHLFVKKQIPT
jgi:predicted RNA-binding protein YlqC (UPF0109 family)